LRSSSSEPSWRASARAGDSSGGGPKPSDERRLRARVRGMGRLVRLHVRGNRSARRHAVLQVLHGHELGSFPRANREDERRAGKDVLRRALGSSRRRRRASSIKPGTSGRTSGSRARAPTTRRRTGRSPRATGFARRRSSSRRSRRPSSTSTCDGSKPAPPPPPATSSASTSTTSCSAASTDHPRGSPVTEDDQRSLVAETVKRSRCIRMWAASAGVPAREMARSSARFASLERPSCMRSAPSTPWKWK
jgi:hypothetical protein